MSLRVEDRQDTDLKVLTLTRNMAAYTLQKCKSYPCARRERWLYPDRIAGHALDALTCVAAANDVYLVAGPNLDTNYAERHRLQVEARCHMASLLSLVQLSVDMGMYAPSSVEHWVRLVSEAMEYLGRWTKSDTSRYSGMSRNRPQSPEAAGV